MTDSIATAAEQSKAEANKLLATTVAELGTYAEGIATLRSTASADFTVMWAHKSFVIFDLALIGAAFVAGHYI